MNTLTKQSTAAEFKIARLTHALSDWRNRPSAYPILWLHGLMERTPDSYMALDPETIDRRCRELIAELSKS